MNCKRITEPQKPFLDGLVGKAIPATNICFKCFKHYPTDKLVVGKAWYCDKCLGNKPKT